MKKAPLRQLARLCKFSGFNIVCKPLYGGIGLILMFHRFSRTSAQRIDGNGIVSAPFLDKLLSYIRSNGPEIIALRDVPQAIARRRKFVCLTIDDGYRDNMEIALPILHRHRAPATIFVPSNVLDRSLDAWWLQVEEMARTQENPQSAYQNMIDAISRNPQLLDDMRPAFPVNQADLNERYFMSDSEVRTIDADPLIEIGGHTVSHPLLKNLSEDDARREIIENKQDLEKLLERPVDIFAYPFGNEQACGPREYELAQQAGYKIAVTTRDGNILPDHEKCLTALPRYSVRGQFEHLAIYDMQRHGSYRALRSRFGPAFVTA